jgi:hypothetical protein
MIDEGAERQADPVRSSLTSTPNPSSAGASAGEVRWRTDHDETELAGGEHGHRIQVIGHCEVTLKGS